MPKATAIGAAPLLRRALDARAARRDHDARDREEDERRERGWIDISRPTVMTSRATDATAPMSEL
jgi:hypothetical protein